MKNAILKTLTVVSLTLIFSYPVFAEPPGHSHGQGPQAMMEKKMGGHGMKKMGHGSGARKMHMFSPMWMQTLTDDQKVAIDKMHLDVAKKQKLIKAKMDIAKVELKLLAIQEKPDMSAINQKIDEIAALKAEHMKVRYAHIVEMRGALTPQQRISYDMTILNHEKKGKHH